MISRASTAILGALCGAIATLFLAAISPQLRNAIRLISNSDMGPDKYFAAVPEVCQERVIKIIEEAPTTVSVQKVPFSYRLPSLWDYNAVIEISIDKITSDIALDITKRIHSECKEFQATSGDSDNVEAEIANWIRIRRSATPDFIGKIRVTGNSATGYFMGNSSGTWTHGQYQQE